MAQALFDDHPLEQYLRAAGEPPEIMPGSAPEFVEDHYYEEEGEQGEEEWRPVLLVQLVEMLKSVFTPPPPSSRFAERFKYDVISSSLLATTLPVPHSRSHSPMPSLPGKLDVQAPPPNPPPLHLVDFRIFSLICALAIAFLALGFYFLTIISLGGATIYLYNHADNAKPDMSCTTMEALNELIAANAQWDAVVQESVTMLEKEEESPPSPVSAIRLSLHSSLRTTQTQCDNVRHLLAALTAPLEAAQLAEMYAPPSPRHSLILSTPVSPLPFAENSRDRDKRSTWAGAPPGMLKNRDRRRSDLSSILPPGTAYMRNSHSAPSTPPATSLGDVCEEGDDLGTQHFGAAALDLHRRRRISGVETLGLRLHPPTAHTYMHTHTPPRTPLSGSSTISHASASGSRFTTMQAVRHPLALSSLYHALDGALAAKRYACSHLLALRFDDQEQGDEGYWEDVRSVMALLTSTFSDAAARLGAALVDAEREEAEFDAPEPAPSGVELPSGRGDRTTMGSMLNSFAPVPTHLTRFAAHVDAISSALDDAREHLVECVAALRDKSPTPEPHLRRRRSRTFSLSRLDGGARVEGAEQAEPLALQAYERLRRELGLALRECERGRDRLLDIVAPPQQHPAEESEEDSSVPSLASDECDEASSDRPEEASPMEERHRDAIVVAPGDGPEVDDVKAHLLLDHLPPPGAEQVFESDAEVGLFTRERSKLTREERIKLAKERRASGARMSVPNTVEDEGMDRQKWGPGGEVVQELKDVIWKVGERRRKMASMS
ncbi:hypothetical protein B0H12DRAFT_1091337 [Mycena haematopus]|nr:hypothetical protein B0H12DRAFT_1091337 [Mycena haematopus]